MNIAEMHVWFRQYAQQMGMQNVRAILPEQIDLLINTSISDTINQIITQNIGVTNDRVVTDNSKISQINALRTLYKVLTVNCNTFNKANESRIKRIYKALSAINGTIPVETKDSKGNTVITYSKTESLNYLFLVDISINYKKDNTITNLFPVRLIDDIYLADTLNDFVLRPRLRSPIAVIYNSQLDVYIDEKKDGNLPGSLTENELRISYIAKPATVKYMADLTSEDDNVDCDLPEHMHVDILKHAVDLYRISVSGALNASQQSEQNQQRENARNNYRNEGNQQQ